MLAFVCSLLCLSGYCRESIWFTDCGHWQAKVSGPVWHYSGPVHVDHQKADPAAFWKSHIPFCRQNCPSVQVKSCFVYYKDSTKYSAYEKYLKTKRLVCLFKDICKLVVDQSTHISHGKYSRKWRGQWHTGDRNSVYWNICRNLVFPYTADMFTM